MNEDGLPSDLGERADSAEVQQDYAALWRLLRRADAATDAAFSVDAAWDDLADRLADDPDVAPSPSETDVEAPAPSADRRASDRPARSSPQQEARVPWRRLAVAALVLLGVAVGATAWWARPVSVQAAAGEQATVTLPDGSTVQLNGATTITYAQGFSSLPWIGAPERRVTLRGEAFFSVTPAARTFQVETPNAVVEVLGTAFSVRARNRGATPVTDVVLASGRVRLSASPADTTGGGAQSVVLTDAGQRSRVKGRGLSPSIPQATDLKYAAAWRQGGFAVRNMPLPAVLRELEVQFGTTLRLSMPAAQTDTMTLHYARDVRLEDVLRDIAVVQNLSYRKMNGGFEFVPHAPTRSPSR